MSRPAPTRGKNRNVKSRLAAGHEQAGLAAGRLFVDVVVDLGIIPMEEATRVVRPDSQAVEEPCCCLVRKIEGQDRRIARWRERGLGGDVKTWRDVPRL